MSTTNTDFLPNATGQNLGSPDQQWDGFFSDVTISGTLNSGGIPIATGNATQLQGVPISPTAPTPNQVLELIAGIWTPATIVGSSNATQLQGNNISANAPAINQALIWDGAQWLPTNQSGGGGGASFGYVAVGFSATPTFTPSPVGSCTFEITLTGNVTSSTFTTAGLSAGTLMTFILNQDATGSRTFKYPSGFLGNTIIGSSPLQTTTQQFLYNGTSFKAISAGLSYP